MHAHHEHAHDAIYADAEFYDRLISAGDSGAEVDFYASMAGEAGASSVLELGCGTGRLLLPLAAAGYAVTGIDIAHPMLRIAEEKAARAGLVATLVHGDVRSFKLDARFGLIAFPHNSIGHLHTFADLRACLRRVHEHLRDDGRFVVDMFNPLPRMLAAEPEAHGLIGRCTAATGEPIDVTETSRYDDAAQLLVRTWHVACAGTLQAQLEFRTRVLFPQEFETLLRLSGFVVEAKYGGFQKEPFSAGSAQQLMVCSKRRPEHRRAKAARAQPLH
jgi:SAM-dependent methyltransferase